LSARRWSTGPNVQDTEVELKAIEAEFASARHDSGASL
jgi:hypothetical protein